MVEEVRNAFTKYDVDKNGFVTADEAKKIFLDVLGFDEDQTGRLMNIYDRDSDGKLKYEEFVDFYERIIHNATEMNDMFGRIDKDKSGTISFSEIKEALSAFGFTDRQINDMIALHDVNKDGILQKEEFARFWLTQL